MEDNQYSPLELKLMYDKRIMEGLIFSYRHKFVELCDDLSSNWGCYISDTYLEEFDKHFGITHDREGKI